MNRWIALLLQNKTRKLELSNGGKWFIGFVILLGVVAVSSGNNVIHLLESLLLSSLILSGILSEQSVLRINVKVVRGQARVNEESIDFFILENLSRFPLYCMEVGEVVNGSFKSLSFILYIPPKSKIRARAKKTFHQRGKYSWSHLAIATSFPFGFAKKIRFLDSGGSRTIWPEYIHQYKKNKKINGKGQLELSPGEIEEIPNWGDISRVHWPTSARANELMALPRKDNSLEPEVYFKVCAPGDELEKRILLAAGELYSSPASTHMILIENKKQKVILGKAKALDVLALLPKG